MHTEKIFDRVYQRGSISDFLYTDKKYIVIHGESGVGKSSVIKSCIYNDNQYRLNNVINYSFLENTKKIKSITFVSYLKVLYKDYRKLSRKIKDAKFGITSAGLGISALGIPSGNISIQSIDYELDEDGLDILLETLYNNDIKIIYISNIELVDNDIDFSALEYIKNHKNHKLKIIFEIGTLIKPKFNTVLTQWMKETYSSLEVKGFDKNYSNGLYSFVNNGQIAPVNIYSKTKGNSFYIVHYYDNKKHYSVDEIVSSKLGNLTHESMKIIYCLYILGGNSSYDELNFYLEINNLEYILDILHSNKIIQLEDKGYCKFYHTFFMQYFNSQTKALGIKKIREIVLNKIVKKDKKNIKDYVIFINQLYELDNVTKLKKYGWIIFKNLYLKQHYMFALNILELLIESLDEHQYNFELLILLQIQLLILVAKGMDARNIVKNNQSQLKNNKLFVLLDAQILYLEDKFPLSNKLINENIFNIENDDYLSALILGYNISNLIAMGEQLSKIRDNYMSAITIVENKQQDIVYFEIIKFASKMHESWQFGINAYIVALKNKNIDKYSYTKAKILHNLGLAKLIATRATNGFEQLEQANILFELAESPEIVYNINAKALYYIVKYKYREAKMLLLDAINLCNERYDRFAIFSNLGNISMLCREFNKAEHYYKKAYNIVFSDIYPLKDPSVEYMANFNLTILYSSLDFWDKRKANKYLKKIKIPKSMKYYDDREKKLIDTKQRILNNIELNIFRNKNYYLNNWTVSEFQFVLVKLHFYDFNLKIINNKNLPDKL